MMLCVISFLAPFTRLSSKQNADAISKGYQFMQQFTLSLKASLAPEAKALERKIWGSTLLPSAAQPICTAAECKMCTSSGKGELAAPSSKPWGARRRSGFCPILPSLWAMLCCHHVVP